MRKPYRLLPAVALAGFLAFLPPSAALAALSGSEYAPLHNTPADRYLQQALPMIPWHSPIPGPHQVLASFHIGPDGSISQARIVGGSGNAEVDQSVLQALSAAGKLPPPPTLDGIWATMVFSSELPLTR